VDSKPLSANTLFHFTDHIDKLEGILKNEFYPNYSLENWDTIVGNNFAIEIPMVCFCDIPLSQINRHIKRYGSYAIGLTKEWGMKKGITPVLYVHKNSATLKNFFKLLKDAYENNTLEKDERLRVLLTYIKPYKGTLIRRKEKEKILINDVTFYDEREWRYVPDVKDLQIDNLLSEEALQWNLSEYTGKLKSKKLSFEPDDIKYIIIEKENEILNMVSRLWEIKEKYSPDVKNILQTRIVSMEHIREDF
jgi:hypothetical protein